MCVCIHFVLVGLFIRRDNYSVSLEYNVADSPPSWSKGNKRECCSIPQFCCPSEMKGGKKGSKAGFEVDSTLETQGLVQEPQPDQSYSSVVTPAL